MPTTQKFFFKASGYVSPGKHNEFEQTVQLIFNMMSPNCVSRSLSIDVHQVNLYHFFSVWSSKDAFMGFRESQEFELLRGAYQTLGATENFSYGPQLTFELFNAVDIGRGDS